MKERRGRQQSQERRLQHICFQRAVQPSVAMVTDALRVGWGMRQAPGSLIQSTPTPSRAPPGPIVEAVTGSTKPTAALKDTVLTRLCPDTEELSSEYKVASGITRVFGNLGSSKPSYASCFLEIICPSRKNKVV